MWRTLREQLDGHVALQPRIPGAEDEAHASTPQTAQDFVRPNPLSHTWDHAGLLKLVVRVLNLRVCAPMILPLVTFPRDSAQQEHE